MSDFMMNAPKNRLNGDMPKVGIRPTIDGRRKGVRESLEEQTMNMAKAAAQLISENLRHPNGLPVECVIADSCIGGVAEAARCAEKFEREGVGVSITVTPCWCYGSETMDMNPYTPKAVWGFNGTERPGAVYLAAVLAAHAQKGLPAFGIYGRDVQAADDTTIPEDVKVKLLQFTKAALAVAIMRGKSYLSIGSVSMGIAGSIIDQSFFESYLGMRVETVDMIEILRRVEEGIYDPDEFAKAEKWIATYCQEGEDRNPLAEQRTRAQKDEDWKFVIKMAMIGRDLMIGNDKLTELGFGEEAQGHNAIAAGFQGQRQWTDHWPNGDFLEAILCSSFDWNGIRQPFIMATENDALNGVCMLFGHLLTNTAQIFSDVRTYWSPAAIEGATGWKPEGRSAGGFIHLINSGATTLDGSGRQERDGQPALKPYWEISEDEAKACLAATSWDTASLGYFRGGGWSSEFLTRGEMPMTMSRLNFVKGVGPVLQIAEGWAANIPDEVHEVLNLRTDPTWPTTWFVPRLTGEGAFQDVYSVMDQWGANHGAISYGHIGSELLTLAAMLRIPVNMHNVPDETIYRPKVWTSFGDRDTTGADFRACANFGPLYGDY